MYKGFFGLKDTPFSIAPNPDYLYLGERHSEALAHLNYGLGETGGFILLTGEVGTGKTTLCRSLLQQLPEDIETAFILNPALSEHELLASICDEFKIRYQKGRATLKTLSDKIRDHLLKNHADGKKTILVIDEAQHLRGEVLEQLRLLTNLETNTSKLLKVILIGQPELQQLLKRQELRQLAQRITARYHLLPLTESEVSAYLNYRLQVAGCERQLFTAKAIKALYKHTQGIPRLLNLLCDRALLGAYANQQGVVDHHTVKRAAAETIEFGNHRQLVTAPVRWLSVATVFIVSLVSSYYIFSIKLQPPTTEVVETVNLLPESKHSQQLSSAFYQLYQIWQQPVSNPAEPCNNDELSCYWMNTNLAKLNKLNLPAILKFSNQNGDTFYGIYLGSQANNQGAKVAFSDGEFVLDPQWFSQHWQGRAVVLWQANVELTQQITANSSIEKLQWLENMLSLTQGRAGRQISVLDSSLLQSLHQAQVNFGLPLTDVADSFLQILLIRSLYPDWPELSNVAPKGVS